MSFTYYFTTNESTGIRMTDKDKKEKAGIYDELIIRIANGEEEAFTELYYETYKQLYAFVLSMTANVHDADDIVQETYIKVKSAAHLYKSQGKALSWMFKIAQNQTRMMWRKTKDITFAELDSINEKITLGEIGKVEDREMLQNAFQILSEQEIKIVTLHLVSGFKHREISDLLELPLATVLSKYRRGLKKMKKYLKEEYHYEKQYE